MDFAFIIRQSEVKCNWKVEMMGLAGHTARIRNRENTKFILETRSHRRKYDNNFKKEVGCTEYVWPRIGTGRDEGLLSIR